MLQSGMGDPQKLANAAATAQEMQQPPQEANGRNNNSLGSQ